MDLARPPAKRIHTVALQFNCISAWRDTILVFLLRIPAKNNTICTSIMAADKDRRFGVSGSDTDRTHPYSSALRP